MDYYMIVGMVSIFLIAFFGFYFALKKQFKEESSETSRLREAQIESTHELTKEIIKLNASMTHLNTDLTKQTGRIDKHGREIDELTKVGVGLKKDVESHEKRIKKLESK